MSSEIESGVYADTFEYLTKEPIEILERKASQLPTLPGTPRDQLKRVSREFLSARSAFIRCPHPWIEAIAFVVRSLAHDKCPCLPALATAIKRVLPISGRVPDGYEESDFVVLPAPPSMQANLTEMVMKAYYSVMLKAAEPGHLSVWKRKSPQDLALGYWCDAASALWWPSSLTERAEFIAQEEVEGLGQLAFRSLFRVVESLVSNKIKQAEETTRQLHDALISLEISRTVRDKYWATNFLRNDTQRGEPTFALHKWAGGKFVRVTDKNSGQVSWKDYLQYHLFREPELIDYLGILAVDPRYAKMPQIGLSAVTEALGPFQNLTAPCLFWLLERYLALLTTALGPQASVLCICLRILLLLQGGEERARLDVIVRADQLGLDLFKLSSDPLSVAETAVTRDIPLVSRELAKEAARVIDTVYALYVVYREGIGFSLPPAAVAAMQALCDYMSLACSVLEKSPTVGVYQLSYAEHLSSFAGHIIYAQDGGILTMRDEMMLGFSVGCMRCGEEHIAGTCFICGAKYCSEKCLTKDARVHQCSKKHKAAEAAKRAQEMAESVAEVQRRRVGLSDYWAHVSAGSST